MPAPQPIACPECKGQVYKAQTERGAPMLVELVHVPDTGRLQLTLRKGQLVAEKYSPAPGVARNRYAPHVLLCSAREKDRQQRSADGLQVNPDCLLCLGSGELVDHKGHASLCPCAITTGTRKDEPKAKRPDFALKPDPPPIRLEVETIGEKIDLVFVGPEETEVVRYSMSFKLARQHVQTVLSALDRRK